MGPPGERGAKVGFLLEGWSFWDHLYAYFFWCCCVIRIFSLFRESLGYQDRKETRDGKVIGYALFVTMCDIRVLKQRWRRWQRERQKNNMFRLAKKQACTSTTLFCTFLCRRYTTTTWNFLVSRFMEDVNSRQRFLFLFLNRNKVL